MASFISLIYAELLSNIRQISIIATLNTASDSTTKVELSADGRQICLFHGANIEVLNLPGQVNAAAQLQKPAIGSKELSWRLPLANQARAVEDEDSSVEAPWSARVLNPESEFVCRGCGAVILKAGAIETWKDLPSEGWAEMMDFWHCHKPDVPEKEQANGHDHEKSNEAAMNRRGYGANSKISAQIGVGFVDITSFLVSEKDCSNITSSEVSLSFAPGRKGSTQSTNLHCTNCSTHLGNGVDEGYRLQKWKLTLHIASPISFPGSREITTPSPSPSPSFTIFFSCVLASTLATTMTSKILLFPRTITPTDIQSNTRTSQKQKQKQKQNQNQNPLLIWIFNPRLHISYKTTIIIPPSTTLTSNDNKPYGTGTGTAMMKLLYQELTPEKAEEIRDTIGIEELSFPEEAVGEFRGALGRSGCLLPGSGRVVVGGAWRVGLVERWGC